jgi:hypothetical protein
MHATFIIQTEKLYTLSIQYKSSSEEDSRKRYSSVIRVSILGLAF